MAGTTLSPEHRGGALHAALRSRLGDRVTGPNTTHYSVDEQRWSAWMRAAQQGDKHCYEQLLRELRTAISAYLRSRLGQTEFIEDVTQECLLSVHAGRQSYDTDRPFRAWLFAIVRHRTIDFLRRQRGPWSIPAADHEDPSELTAPESLQAACEASTLLAQLNPAQREIIVLMKYLGLSAEESGQYLGISVASARVRLHRALHEIRRLLRSDRLETS